MPIRPCILVVEDDPLVAEVIAAALEEDFAPNVVDTSAAAVRCLAEGGIDLILLDCTLPDGIDSALLPAADQAQVPVVLMSGDPQRVAGLALKPRPFILKPFALAELIAMVRREINGTAHVAA